MHRMPADKLASDTMKLNAFFAEDIKNADIFNLCLGVSLRKLKRDILDKLGED